MKLFYLYSTMITVSFLLSFKTSVIRENKTILYYKPDGVSRNSINKDITARFEVLTAALL